MSNEETKYLIDIIEEEISEAEEAKSKTPENLSALETKIEGMMNEDVGNNDDLRNKALEIIGTEATNLKNQYMARKRETKRKVNRMKQGWKKCFTIWEPE